MNFLDRLTAETSGTLTENGAKAYKTTGSACLDFFALGGAKRNDPDAALELFKKAFAEDKQTAIRILYYIRDIRGGQGERKIFRTCYNWVASNYPKISAQTLTFIDEYGRWDDLLQSGFSIAIRDRVKTQLEADLKAKHPSLLAKWMPSENTSSKKTQKLAREWQKALEWKPAKYRKALSAIRKKIGLLEQDMSANNWENIQYDKIPGQAFRKHTKAFARHDKERFEAFINRAKKVDTSKGEKQLIKTNTIFTYEVFDMVKQGRLDEADAVWANLPHYEVGDALVMADVSRSMEGRPMSISVSLALYFAEHNKGFFHNKFMTFSAEPELMTVRGETLQEKMRNIEGAHWDMNTDLNKALDTILRAAQGCPIEEVPKVLYVISDMEFDMATKASSYYSYNITPYHAAKEKWDAAGIPMPTVVFWNVNSRQNQVPTVNEEGVVLLSGSSQSTFRYAVDGKDPMEFMNSVVNSERYSQIVIK